MKVLIKKKHKLWGQFYNSKSQETWKEYKRVRNAVRKASRDAIQSENLAVAKSCKENPKKFWKHVKSKTSTYSSISNITQVDNLGNTVTITNDAEKVNVFCGILIQSFYS